MLLLMLLMLLLLLLLLLMLMLLVLMLLLLFMLLLMLLVLLMLLMLLLLLLLMLLNANGKRSGSSRYWRPAMKYETPKPCPECGEDWVRIDMDLSNVWAVCMGCGHKGEKFTSPTEAIAAWNALPRGGDDE